MTINPSVIDLVVAIAILAIMLIGIWRIPPSGSYGEHVTLSIVAVIVTVVIFTVLYAVRFQAIFVCAGAFLLLSLYNYFMDRRRNRRGS